MNVAKLIEILEDCDPEAEVYVMSQQHYPFEHGLFGVAVREKFDDESDCEDNDAEPRGSENRWSTPDSKLPRNDVFLVEGSQTRYGTKMAWVAARRG